MKYFSWNADGQGYLVVAKNLKEAEKKAYAWWLKDCWGGKDDEEARGTWKCQHEVKEFTKTKCPDIYVDI
jgi:hypothetical protein